MISTISLAYKKKRTNATPLDRHSIDASFLTGSIGKINASETCATFSECCVYYLLLFVDSYFVYIHIARYIWEQLLSLVSFSYFSNYRSTHKI